MADRDFVVKNGLRTVSNTIVANNSSVEINANLVIANSVSLTANGSTGAAGQYLISNGTGIYWATVAAGVNTAAQYAWSNTHSFSNVVTFNANLVVNNSLVANGGVGSAGQVLTSNGSSGPPYWSTVVGVNTAAAYTFTNTIIFTNTVTTNGRLILDNTLTANGSNGTSGQVLTSNGNTGTPYWSTPANGTVTSISTSNGVTGGPITSTGTISIQPNTGIVANSSGVFVANTYLNTTDSFAVNGQFTFANVQTFNANVVFGKAISANGSFGSAGHALFSGGGSGNNYFSNVVTSVAVTSNQLSASYSGANPTIGLSTISNVVAGAYTLATVTVDSFGRIAGIANGSSGGSGTVTSITQGTGLSFSTTPITTTGTISLAASGVANGTYTLHGFTVDTYGRITATTSLQSASTSQQGVVQLSSSTSSTSTTLAATASAVKSAYDLANSKGSGTVTSVATGNGLTGGTITGSGTLSMSGSYTGSFSATGDITAYSSDERLKTNIKPIENAVDKVKAIRGVTYDWNELAAGFGFDSDMPQVGVIAQEIQKVLPEVIKAAPFDTIQEDGSIGSSLSGENYLTVQYDKIVPLLIEAIKEQQKQIEELKAKIGG